MDTERELLRLWSLVSDITDQLNHNRAITSRLQSQAGQLRDHAGQASEGVILRRFNTDVSKEVFTSELERLSVALVMENQSLLHENKQLTSLLQEYEQTLESVMAKFRGHCYAAQTHQLTLGRHYEALLSRDRGDDVLEPRGIDVDHLNSLATHVRRAIRSIDGTDAEEEHPVPEAQAESGEKSDENKIEEEMDINEGSDNWAEVRELEIKRYEEVNAMLRRALGISPEQEKEFGLECGDLISPSSSFSPDPYPSLSSPSREFRTRTNSRLGPGPQRRSGLPVFSRRGFGEVASAPERTPSPPNEPRWSGDTPSGPVVESI